MADIYIDASGAGVPDAADRLDHLLGAGHTVVLVGDCPQAVVAALPRARRAAGIPAKPKAGSWYVTADPAICADRPPGVRTLLVGPRVAPGPRLAPRCDAEARDLASAVLEILSRDAMG